MLFHEHHFHLVFYGTRVFYRVQGDSLFCLSKLPFLLLDLGSCKL